MGRLWSVQFAIGANAQAAHFSGIRVARTKFWLYVVSGAVAGLAGVLWTLRYSSARADNGAGLTRGIIGLVIGIVPGADSDFQAPLHKFYGHRLADTSHRECGERHHRSEIGVDRGAGAA